MRKNPAQEELDSVKDRLRELRDEVDELIGDEDDDGEDDSD